MFNYPENWLHAYQPERVQGELFKLLNDLEAAGCKGIPGADAFKRIRNLTPRPPTDLGALGAVLDADPGDLLDWTRETALTNLARHQEADRLILVRAQATAEMLELLRAGANDLIAQMRPAFNTAADAAREVLRLGVKPTDAAEDVMKLGEAASRAWLSFKGADVRTLEQIAGTRIELSAVAGIPPYNDTPSMVRQIDYGSCFGVGGLLLPTRDDHRPSHQYWLEVAPTMTLYDVNTDDLVNLRALGVNTERFESAAATIRAAASADTELNG